MSAKAAKETGVPGNEFNRRLESVNERAASRFTHRRRSHAPSRRSLRNRPYSVRALAADNDAGAAASAVAALGRPTIREGVSPFKIAQRALYTNIDLGFPTEWWEKRREEHPGRKNPQEVLKIKQHVFNKYARENQGRYHTFMTGLKSLAGYVRIVTQNMHCRQQGGPERIFSSCDGEKRFLDNQTERAVEFAKLINTNDIFNNHTHVIAIQELQEPGARGKFIETLNKERYGYWFPKAGVSYTGFNTRFDEVHAGQGFVWNKNKVNLLQKEFLLFPTEFSSGANAAAVSGTHSFKAVAFAQFQLIRPEDRPAAMGGAGGPAASAAVRATGAKFSVFNIHPSPYVQSDELADYRSQYEIDMVASHLYQFTLTAQRIKEHLKANRDDYVFVCGDWNVNKYFQNGFSEKGTRKDIDVFNKNKILEPIITEYFHYKKNYDNFTKNKDHDEDEAAEMQAYLRRIVRKFGEKQHLLQEYEEQSKAHAEKAKALNTPVVGRGIKEVVENTTKLVQEREPCFRDDIPFTNNNNCDFQSSGGSEYMTVSEILGTIPPTHLYSLSEHDTDIPAPYGGKYTWDGLLNSVMYSPYWSSRAFQLLDHIVYSKYGKIPIYAHTMTKRYLTTVPVLATEGPLSQACRHDNKKDIPDNLKPYSVAGTYSYKEGRIPTGRRPTLTISSNVHRYVDIADHYGVECVAILDTDPETINRLADLGSAFYKSAKFWVDPFLPQNLDGLCLQARLAIDAAGAAAGAGAAGAPTFNKFQIPKLWELLSNEYRFKEFIESQIKLNCGRYNLTQIITQIVKTYILKPDYPTAEIMTHIPDSNKEYILNHYVLKMANRLIEREYLNRINFNHKTALRVPFGKFTCENKGNTLYQCNITRKMRNTIDRERGLLLKQANRGNINRFSRRAPRELRSPNITNDNGRYSELKLKKILSTRERAAAAVDAAAVEEAKRKAINESGLDIVHRTLLRLIL